MRRNSIMLIVTLALVGAALANTVLGGSTPQLGLDLQGGISVAYAPKGEVRNDALDKAVEIIRRRVDSLGVAEPEISRQGDNIVVDLPGVKNRDRALKIVGQTAELRFRPVLGTLPKEGAKADPTTTTKPAKATSTTAASGGASSTAGVVTTTATPAPAGVTSSTAAATTTTASELVPGAEVPTSKVDDPKASVVLPDRKEALRYQLGPSEATGKIVKSVRARFEQGQWGVNVNFTGKGSKEFDALAAKYVNKQLAIVLDGMVQSAPVIQSADFNGTAVISGSFTEKESKDLALVLRYGSLPVELKELTVQSVSPTLGRDQLRSGMVAGFFGLALVALYMLIYYRLLGLVVWAGLLLSAAMIYTLTTFLGGAIGLTLTLAGVTGLIVSVGVTVDSYVVYFERLKDEVRSGKTMRSSLDRAFTRSFRTILAADFVSLIGAGLLYLLAVGSVRGFAFFLGMSTLLDILVAYVFMHPLVAIIGRSPRFAGVGWLGVATGLDAPSSGSRSSGVEAVEEKR